MSDTVKKLRSLALKLHHLGDGQLVNDASDVMVVAAIEIEKLCADLITHQNCCDGAAAQDAHVRQEREEHRAEVERLRKAATSAGAALNAAIELLERGSDTAPSKRMLSQMLADYRVIVARTRNALEGKP